MKKSIHKRMIAVTVLLLSLMQMAPTGLSPMLAGVSETFPEASAESIQFLITMSGIFVLVLSLVSAVLTQRFSKKLLICIGCISMMLAGILPVAFHESMAVLRIWSALLGIGMGLLCGLAISLLTDYFAGPEKAQLMGIQSGANNLGAMMMSLAGGVLASSAWYLNYLVLLLVLPGFLCCILFVPGEKKRRLDFREKTEAGEKRCGGEGQKIRINGTMITYAAIGMLFLFCFNAVPTNLSMYLAENGMGNAKEAGVASAMCLLGGTLAGVFFGKVNRLLRIYTIPLGYICLCAGIAVISWGHTPALLLAGCFMAGSAITFVMPQCMMQATKDVNPGQAAMGTAMMMAGGNLGTFLTPLISTAACRITGSSVVVNRYHICIAMTFVLAVALAAGMRYNEKKADKNMLFTSSDSCYNKNHNLIPDKK